MYVLDSEGCYSDGPLQGIEVDHKKGEVILTLEEKDVLVKLTFNEVSLIYSKLQAELMERNLR
jgi:hypothetical protein